jgi:hypothetical protein
MNKAHNAAHAIKAKLIEMAINDTLPMDMTLLDESMLKEIIEKEIGLSEDEEIIERMKHYLSNEESELPSILDTIKDKLDTDEEDDLIDGVEYNNEGSEILVWQPLEGQYTFKQFAELIGL